jgi:hypothetical protein
MIQWDNRGSVVATQSLLESEGLGVFFQQLDDLASQLYDLTSMKRLSENVWNRRLAFTFDQHVPRLLEFFRATIQH